MNSFSTPLPSESLIFRKRNRSGPFTFDPLCSLTFARYDTPRIQLLAINHSSTAGRAGLTFKSRGQLRKKERKKQRETVENAKETRLDGRKPRAARTLGCVYRTSRHRARRIGVRSSALHHWTITDDSGERDHGAIGDRAPAPAEAATRGSLARAGSALTLRRLRTVHPVASSPREFRYHAPLLDFLSLGADLDRTWRHVGV